MTKWSQRSAAVVSAILFAVILTALNVLVNDRHERFDLTRDKRYSVSPELKGLLGKLEDSITITIYVSPDLPPQLLAPKRTAEDFLREIANEAGGNLRLRVMEVANPNEKGIKEELEKFGVAPMQLQVASREGFTVRSVLFHMLVQYRDKSQVLPIPRLDEFEFAFARTLLRVSQTSRPLVYVIDTEKASEFLRLIAGLKRGGIENLVDIEPIDASEARPLYLPEKLDLVLLSAREPLTDRQKFELDQYLLYGGKLIVFAEGAPYDDPMMFFKQEDKLPNLREFLASYGVQVSTELVQDWGSCVSAPVKVGERGGVAMYSIDAFPFPILPIIKGENLEFESPALRSTQRLLMPFATRVTGSAVKGTDVQFSQLMWTSDKADSQTSGPYLLDQPKPGTPIPEKVSRIPLAVAAKGMFKSAFRPGSIPPPEPKPLNDPFLNLRYRSVSTAPTIGGSKKPGELVVIGSAHMFWQNFLESIASTDSVLAQSNVAFLQNLIESYTIGQELAKVRSKQTRQAFLDTAKVEKHQQAAKVLGTFAVPVLIIVLGIIWSLLRKARMNSLIRRYSK